MTFLLGLIVVLVGYAAYRLADDFIRRSMRSYANAERVMTELISAAEQFVERDLPASVARLVVGMVAITGCGCFIRGLLFIHYLPRLRFTPSASQSEVERGFADLERLDSAIREEFSKVLAYVIVYDSYRNPMQGWLFRRALRQAFGPQTDPSDRWEAKMAAFSVLSRRASLRQTA